MRWIAIAITVNKKTILFPCGGLINRRMKMSNLYNDTTNALLNAVDIQKTIESNNLNNIKRVHSGTANEDTLEDLINDVVSFLENLTEQLKENENE